MTALIMQDATGARQNMSVTTNPLDSNNFVGSTCVTDPLTGAKQAVSASGSASVNGEGVRPTYRYYSSGNTPAATPTDVFTITGSGTKTVRIKKIILSGFAATAGQFVWSLIRRSAANSGGTSTTPAAMKHDTNDAAATAVLKLYTVNPASLGTTVGAIRGGRLFHSLATAQSDRLEFNFSVNMDKPPVLRGTTDIIAINGSGVALPAGAALDIEIEFEEDNS